METETKTDVQLVRHPVGTFALGHRGSMDYILLSPAELQAVVQQAYDEHGILATPSYRIEQHVAGVNADELTDALRAAHNAGVRA